MPIQVLSSRRQPNDNCQAIKDVIQDWINNGTLALPKLTNQGNPFSNLLYITHKDVDFHPIGLITHDVNWIWVIDLEDVPVDLVLPIEITQIKRNKPL